MNTRQTKANTFNRIALSVLIILVSLFCLLSISGALGGVGEMVYGVIVGFFGLASYAYSVVGIIIGICILFGAKIKISIPKLLLLIGIFAFGILALQIHTSNAHIVGANYKSYLLACYYKTNTAGGMLYGILAYPLMKSITTVGALSLSCALIFALALIACFPFVKKNVTYTSTKKSHRDSKKISQPNKVAPSVGYHKLDGQKSPSITDFNGTDGQGLYIVEVDGDPLQRKSRRLKGADGYNPLFPNALGNLEDELKVPENSYKADEFTPRGLARDILFSQQPNAESIDRFNANKNLNDAMSNVGAPFSAVRRNELKNKLGIDSTKNAIKNDFLTRYSDRVNEENSSSSEELNKLKLNENIDFKNDYDTLKQDQIKKFNEMYFTDEKPEFESTAYFNAEEENSKNQIPLKKEVAKPKVNRSHLDINQSTANKAQDAINKQTASNMAGFQGAVARAINGEEQSEKIYEAVGYDRPKFGSKKSEKKNKIPRAFEDSSVDKNNDSLFDAKNFSNKDKKTSFEKQNAQMTKYGYKKENEIAKRAQDAISKKSNEEIKAIKQAQKEVPPLSEYEFIEESKENRLKIEKVRANRENSKSEQMAKKMNNFDTKKERITQVNIDQAISQVSPKSPYVAPPLSLLNAPEPEISQNEDYEYKKRVLVDTLAFFDIGAEVTDIMVGPTFSLYTLKIEMPRGKTIGSIVNLENDIAMKMEEESVRILAPIPGKNAVGIEVPNKHRRIVRLSEMICSPSFNKSKSPATFALGKNLYGNDYVCNVKELPHMLIAGATGAGKSCCINSVIISLLYKASPEDVRLILIDPKRVELSVYEGIPHLLLDEIICDVDKAIRAFNWAITEMNRRIEYLSNLKYRDIDEYNEDCKKQGYEKMPRIVIVVDELADLMSMGKKSVEDSINRIARLARAVGIHLILATQRPSVDVVSGTIKNNLPSRVAFKVTSGPDSRTILDANGADKLLGNGDLLYMTPKVALPERMQGAFISNSEVKAVVDFIKKYNDSYFDSTIKDAIFKEPVDEKAAKKKSAPKSNIPPELFEALRIGMNNGGTISISHLQRKLGLGWPKAAKIYDMIDDMGYLVQDEKDPKRKRINITAEEFEELVRENMPEED